MRLFSALPASNKKNWHNLASVAEYMERADWSENKKVDIEFG